MSKVMYRVTLGERQVGFFESRYWSEAQRAGASAYNKEHGENIPWEQFDAKWVNPKDYERLGIVLEEEDSEDEA